MVVNIVIGFWSIGIDSYIMIAVCLVGDLFGVRSAISTN